MQCSSRSKFQVVLGGAMQIPGTRWSGNLTPGLISRLQCPQAVGLFMIEQIPVMALREDVCPMRDGGFRFMFSLCTLQIGDMWRCLLYFYVRLFSSVKKKLMRNDNWTNLLIPASSLSHFITSVLHISTHHVLSSRKVVLQFPFGCVGLWFTPFEKLLCSWMVTGQSRTHSVSACNFMLPGI